MKSVREFVEENRGDLRQATRSLNLSLDTFADHAGAISRNLEETTRSMNEFSEQIRENPSLILRGRRAAEDPAEPVE